MFINRQTGMKSGGKHGFLVPLINLVCVCKCVWLLGYTLMQVEMFASPSAVHLCISLMLTAGVDLNHRGDTPSRCPSPHGTSVNPTSSAGGRLPLCGPAGTPARPGCWSRCVWGRGGSGPPGRPPPPTASNRSPFEAVRPQRRRRRRRQVHLWPGDQRL